MSDRRGEKIGWVAGWCGGFVWVVVLSIVFFVQGKMIPGALGLLLSMLAVVGIVRSSPWRHPRARYWKLMLVPYALFLASAAWAVWAFGGLARAGVDAWMLLWLVPLLLPFWTVGRKKWTDFEFAAADAAETPPAGK